MIAYLPELYEDELVYSWFARYFAHMYPSYINAVEDLMENRNTRTDFDFINHLDADARKIISRAIPMEDLIIWHTMFPLYRFVGHERLCNALESMVNTVGGCTQNVANFQKQDKRAGPLYQVLPAVCSRSKGNTW